MSDQRAGQAIPKGTWERQNLDGHRVAHAMVDVLAKAGVREIFGQSCPTAICMAADQKGIRQIGYRTENAGAAMADGAARISGRISVILAQNGPAAALLVAGLAEALKASIPILAIVQEVPRTTADKNAFQELDHEKLFAGCTKWIRRINLAERAAEYTARAIQIATSGRPGPVVLLVSPDVLTQEVPGIAPLNHGADTPFGSYPADRFVPTATGIKEAANLLVKARQPLVIVGGGVHHSGAENEVARLQMVAGVPVATTNMGKGVVDESQPLSIGVVGNSMGTRAPAKFLREYIQGADVILFAGTRTNENGTSGWSLFPAAATYIQIDIDPEELGRNYPALRLLGDAKESLAALNTAIEKLPATGLAARTKQIEQVIAQARAKHAQESAAPPDTPPGLLHPETVVHALATIRDQVTWVADASYASIWLVQYLPSLRAGTRFLTPRGIAGLGWGFPMAIGAKLAAPDKRVICLTGDGGFAHCWAELETARRHGIPVTVIVLNNGVLGFQINAEESRFGSHTEVCHFGPIDHVAIAKACGCDGMQVQSLDELTQALDTASRTTLPYVIDVKTDPAAFPPITAFESQRRGS
jgi:acetolactate synthase-1/2/3 large subunit